VDAILWKYQQVVIVLIVGIVYSTSSQGTGVRKEMRFSETVVIK